jgi:formylglycine-generating enzyme required for sulfatase activity
MAFVHVPGTQLRFSIWETRVRDFDAFARTDRYDAEEALTAFASIDGPRRTWRRPGFSQGPDYPVVLVDWESARRFCEWLTRHERLSRRIALTQAYRLPTDAEWNAAVGAGAYPWGDQFPPPSRAGNYAGEEALEAVQSQWFRVLRNYADGHARTAPVGSFPANRLGIHDLGGNVGEWCADWYRRDMLSRELERLVPFRNNDGGGQAYRVVRGASWLDSHPAVLRSAVRLFEFPDHCSDNIGFRVVLETPRP